MSLILLSIGGLLCFLTEKDGSASTKALAPPKKGVKKKAPPCPSGGKLDSNGMCYIDTFSAPKLVYYLTCVRPCMHMHAHVLTCMRDLLRALATDLRL